MTESQTVDTESLYDLMAETLDFDNFYYSDMNSNLLVETDEVAMEARAYGPSNTAFVLRNAVDNLKHSDGSFHGGIDYGNYGLHLQFTRQGNQVTVERIREIYSDDGPGLTKIVTERNTPRDRTTLPLAGPTQVEATWPDFLDAVEEYNHWHLTEHLNEAPWLRRIPRVQQWIEDQGL